MSQASEQIATQYSSAAGNRKAWYDLLYNVKDPAYGASGDGSTDDTAFIQRALDNGEGGIVYLPPGVYMISSSLVIKSGTELLSLIPGAAILRASSGLALGAPILKNKTQGGAVDAYYDTGIKVSGIVFDGNNISSRTAEMVSFLKAQHVTFDSCTFQNATHIGMALAGCYSVDVLNCRFTGLGRPKPSTISAPALWVDKHGDGSKNKYVNVSGCKFYNNNWSGAYFMPDGGNISRCEFVDNGESSIFISSLGSKIRISDCLITGAVRSNISASGIECGANYVTISDTQIYQCQSNGVALTDSQNVTITNLIAMNNGQDGTAFPDASGVVIITTNAAPNQPKNIKITNSIFSDDQTVKTQVYGLQVGNNGAAVENVEIVNNNLKGNKTAAVSIASGKFGTGSHLSGNLGYNGIGDPKVSEFQAPAATGSHTVTGVGFKPRVIEFHAIEASGTRANQCTSKVTASSSITHYSFSAAAGSYGSTAARAIALYDNAGTLLCEATLTSMNDDGFTLNFTNVTVRPYISYTAYP